MDEGRGWWRREGKGIMSERNGKISRRVRDTVNDGRSERDEKVKEEDKRR